MTGAPNDGGPAPRGGVEDRTARNIGVGCFTTFIGTWSGAMVAVLIGKIVESVRGAPSCEGVPICNWNVYAAVGALIGATTLPLLVLNRLRRRDVRRDQISRG
ncbi:MAG TPA: hypothetical protein VM076_14790 [Gemmatimonadaceae bacterium]|nr:hypothetical protein [Gemmatimonadaceae bacterium]